MGYYTMYSLSTDADDETLASVLQETIYGGSELLSGAFEEAHKWYDHEDDMRRISNAYKGVTFRLDGEGEDEGDKWRKWFRSGKKIAHIKVVMPPDPVGVELTEVDYDTVKRLNELGKERAEYERLAKKFGDI
jgi:hypothetical protein